MSLFDKIKKSNKQTSYVSLHDGIKRCGRCDKCSNIRGKLYCSKSVPALMKGTLDSVYYVTPDTVCIFEEE